MTTHISAHVEEPACVARRNYPVTHGCPFPQGHLFDTQHVRIVNGERVEIPVQSRILASWPDGSIKWLLLDTQIDLRPREVVPLSIEYGDKMYKTDDDRPYTGKVFDLYKSNGNKKVEGYYKDGLRNRKWEWWSEDGKMDSSGTYKDGKKDGLWTKWYENGQKKEEGNYKDDKKDGFWTEWYENGQISAEGLYKNKKLEGLVTFWHTNGKKKLEGIFKNGEKDKLWTEWYENGQKQSEGTYKDNIPDGEYKCWDKDGGVIYETEFVNGTGVLKEFYENEQMGEEMIYKNGEIIEFKFFELNYNKD